MWTEKHHGGEYICAYQRRIEQQHVIVVQDALKLAGDGLLGLHLAVPAESELNGAPDPVFQADQALFIPKLRKLNNFHFGKDYTVDTERRLVTPASHRGQARVI